MLRYVPVILGVLAIVGFTVVEADITGRLQSSNITEEKFTAMLEEVPQDIGDWHGEDLPVEAQVKKTSGARGYVSREYRNSVTGEKVVVWLIVGHSKDVVRHTPDVCYPSSGFKMRAPRNSRQTFSFEGQPPADFYTNTFIKEDSLGRELVRVFWSWYKPSDDATVMWKAPGSVRWEFGNARSLYKLYFSSPMQDIKETTDDSPCLKFAEEFLPVVAKALSTAGMSTPDRQSDAAADAATPDA